VPGCCSIQRNNEQFRYPDPEDGQAVEAGMAAGADGDQALAVVEARLPMMHMEAGSRPAGAAEAADGGEVLAAGTE